MTPACRLYSSTCYHTLITHQEAEAGHILELGGHWRLPKQLLQRVAQAGRQSMVLAAAGQRQPQHCEGRGRPRGRVAHISIPAGVGALPSRTNRQPTQTQKHMLCRA